MKKYQKGEKIRDIGELSNENFIYLADKVYHIGWYGSWPYRLLKLQIDNGNVWRAIKIKGEIE